MEHIVMCLGQTLEGH